MSWPHLFQLRNGVLADHLLALMGCTIDMDLWVMKSKAETLVPTNLKNENPSFVHNGPETIGHHLSVSQPLHHSCIS